MKPHPDAISLRGITKVFGSNVRACDDVSLRIGQGETVALLGPNGAGKTTLIDIALGLQNPTSGSSRLLGMCADEAVSRGLVGVVNQSGALPGEYKVSQLLAMFHGFYEGPLSVDEVTALAHLDSLAGRRIRKLSGGEQQRVRLALALLPNPLVLFLDEPTAGMDPAARLEFWRVMNQATDQGKTVLFATHYLAEAEEHANRTVIMRGGRVAADAPTAQLLGAGRWELTIDIDGDAYEATRPVLDRPEWEASWLAGTLTIRGRDLDDAARILLAVPQAANLRITDSSMEEVFTSLAQSAEDSSGTAVQLNHTKGAAK